MKWSKFKDRGALGWDAGYLDGNGCNKRYELSLISSFIPNQFLSKLV